jgi:hypothetical protein
VAWRFTHVSWRYLRELLAALDADIAVDELIYIFLILVSSDDSIDKRHYFDASARPPSMFHNRSEYHEDISVMFPLTIFRSPADAGGAR